MAACILLTTFWPDECTRGWAVASSLSPQCIESSPLHQSEWLTCGFSIVLLGSSSAESTSLLLAGFRDFERPEHASRSAPGTQTCAVVYRRAPCVPRSREREKRPSAVREKFCIPQKKSISYTCVYTTCLVIAGIFISYVTRLKQQLLQILCTSTCLRRRMGPPSVLDAYSLPLRQRAAPSYPRLTEFTTKTPNPMAGIIYASEMRAPRLQTCRTSPHVFTKSSLECLS